MFMSYIGPLSSIVGRKEDKYVIWELIYELCISYGPYKETIKFYELLTICCVQRLMWSAKLPLMGLWMKSEVGRLLNQKHWELGHSSTSYAILNPHVSHSNSYTHFKVYPMCIRPTQWIYGHSKPSYASMPLKLDCWMMYLALQSTKTTNKEKMNRPGSS